MKPVILCDIDHSIADSFWRDPIMNVPRPDWDEYHAASIGDKPIEATVRLLRALHRSGWLIVGFTARPAKWQKLSNEWLYKWTIPMHEMLMRPDDNFRPATELKMELVIKRFGPDFAEVVTLMLEDREDVTAMFRAAGVTVLQVHAARQLEKMV